MAFVDLWALKVGSGLTLGKAGSRRSHFHHNSVSVYQFLGPTFLSTASFSRYSFCGWQDGLWGFQAYMALKQLTLPASIYEILLKDSNWPCLRPRWTLWTFNGHKRTMIGWPQPCVHLCSWKTGRFLWSTDPSITVMQDGKKKPGQANATNPQYPL